MARAFPQQYTVSEYSTQLQYRLLRTRDCVAVLFCPVRVLGLSYFAGRMIDAMSSLLMPYNLPQLSRGVDRRLLRRNSHSCAAYM